MIQKSDTITYVVIRRARDIRQITKITDSSCVICLLNSTKRLFAVFQILFDFLQIEYSFLKISAAGFKNAFRID